MPYDWTDHKIIPEVQTDEFRSWRFVQRPGRWSGYGTCRIYCIGAHTFLIGDAGDCIIRKPADEPWFQSISLEYFAEKLEAIDRRAQWEVLDFDAVRDTFASRAFDELDELADEVFEDMTEEDDSAPPSTDGLTGYARIAATVSPELFDTVKNAKGFWRAQVLQPVDSLEGWISFLVAAEFTTEADVAQLGPFMAELMKRWRDKCKSDAENEDAYNAQGARSFLAPAAHNGLLECCDRDVDYTQIPDDLYDHLSHYGEADEVDCFFKPGDAILVYHALLREFSRQVNMPAPDKSAYW